MHIIQAKLVGGKCPWRRRRRPEYAGGALVISPRFIGHTIICVGGDGLPVGLAAYGPALTAIVRQIGGDRRAYIERAGRSRATGVFPLRFAGQTIVSPGYFRETTAELLRLVPRYGFDWKIVTFEERRERIKSVRELSRVLRHHCRPLGLRHRPRAHKE